MRSRSQGGITEATHCFCCKSYCRVDDPNIRLVDVVEDHHRYCDGQLYIDAPLIDDDDDHGHDVTVRTCRTCGHTSADEALCPGCGRDFGADDESSALRGRNPCNATADG